MQKTVFILDGDAGGKNILNKILSSKYKDYFWVWNTNPRNPLGQVVFELFGQVKRDNLYYEFIDRLQQLADEIYDYTREKIYKDIASLLDNQYANLLIVHNCPDYLVEEIKNEISNVVIKRVLILQQSEILLNNSECDVLLTLDSDFDSRVCELLDAIKGQFFSGMLYNSCDKYCSLFDIDIFFDERIGDFDNGFTNQESDS